MASPDIDIDADALVIQSLYFLLRQSERKAFALMELESDLSGVAFELRQSRDNKAFEVDRLLYKAGRDGGEAFEEKFNQACEDYVALFTEYKAVAERLVAIERQTGPMKEDRRRIVDALARRVTALMLTHGKREVDKLFEMPPCDKTEDDELVRRWTM
ncbi:Hypothetical predicted protein [Lecanosticta acicola]|uniref:Uncharacterized protein n=1 Tax=Lecanosticta acicola TaxID=111012 RepID=A0AAI8YUA4_9PEZI|nr:Hypothetical predicted protein [Lecanosticta acicola]